MIITSARLEGPFKRPFPETISLLVIFVELASAVVVVLAAVVDVVIVVEVVAVIGVVW